MVMAGKGVGKKEGGSLLGLEQMKEGESPLGRVQRRFADAVGRAKMEGL